MPAKQLSEENSPIRQAVTRQVAVTTDYPDSTKPAVHPEKLYAFLRGENSQFARPTTSQAFAPLEGQFFTHSALDAQIPASRSPDCTVNY